MDKPRVLVACEFSGVVRRAFRDAGCDAWSCDLLPAEDGSEFHIQADVDDVLWSTTNIAPFNLTIGHPPCTYLANSSVRWLYNKDGSRNETRWSKMLQACLFFAKLWKAPCSHVVLENPIMHKHAAQELTRLGVPNYAQTFQPWQHGHGEVKRTCLWLRGLPALAPSNVVSGRTPRVHHASPGPDRWKERSRTLEGVARAMANQWSPLLFNNNTNQ